MLVLRINIVSPDGFVSQHCLPKSRLDFACFQQFCSHTLCDVVNVARRVSLLMEVTWGDAAGYRLLNPLASSSSGGNSLSGFWWSFMICVIITSWYITKGAGRIAEVWCRLYARRYARKQMAIDAD